MALGCDNVPPPVLPPGPPTVPWVEKVFDPLVAALLWVGFEETVERCEFELLLEELGVAELWAAAVPATIAKMPSTRAASSGANPRYVRNRIVFSTFCRWK